MAGAVRFPQAFGHLAVGIDLWHNGGEGFDAAMALETRHIKVNGHRPAMTRHVTHEQRLVLMDDDFACRAAEWALAGDCLRLATDMILSRCFPEINDIKAGKVQDIDWHGGRRKERILAALPPIP